MTNNLNELHEQTTQDEVSEQAPETEETKDTPSPQESFREMREKLKREEEEKERLRQELAYLRQQQEQQASQKQEEWDLDKLSDDDLPSVGHVKSTSKRLAKQLQNYEDRLLLYEMRDRHRDFNEVVNQDTMKQLATTDPILAKMIYNNPNKEEQLEMSYRAIKKYGIFQPKEQQEKEMLQEYNTTKPRPSNAVTSPKKSALSEASSWGNSVLTKEMKEEIYRKARLKASGG